MDRASTAQFGKAINALRAIASSDKYRHNLNGICFEKDRAIATDGHRACIVKAEVEGNFEDRPLIPIAAIPTIKAKHTLHLVMPETGKPDKVTFNLMNCNPDNFMTSTVSPANADFPDIEQVRPKEEPVYTVKLDIRYVQELLEVHKQAGAKHATFEFHGDRAPCRIITEGVESILMPIDRRIANEG